MIDTQTFQTRIRRFSRARRGVLNAVTGYLLGWRALLAGVLALLFLGGVLPGTLLNATLFAALAMFLLCLVIVGVVRYVRFRSDLEEAFHLEELAGNLNSRIVSAWDFLGSGFMTPLTRAVVARAAEDLRQDHEARLDRAARNQQRNRFLVWLAVFVVLGLTPWFSFARVADNGRRTWFDLGQLLFPVQYLLLPGEGSHVYKVGSTVEVALQFQRQGYPQVKMIRQVGDTITAADLTVDAGGAVRATIDGDVEAEHVIHFEFGDRRTPDMTLIFTLPPTLVNMQTELVYPLYTRLLPRSLEGVQSRLLGLPGTRMTLGFTFSKELASAELTWDDGQKLPLETTGRFATVSLLHTRERTARLQVQDIHGFSLDEPLPTIDFAVQIDEKPQVLLPAHLKEEMLMLEPAARLFGFGVQAQDDFGVTRLVLKWREGRYDSPTSTGKLGELERLISPEQPKTIVSFEKVFAGLALAPGDKISFWVEAYDNRRPDRQMTVSRTCSFVIHQEDLAGLMVKELGFGKGADFMKQRIAKSTRATSVKEPEGIRTKENVRNDFEASVNSGTRPPTVRGEHGQATQDYFRLLSTVKYQEEEKPKK